MKVYRIRARRGPDIVDAAQVIVGMAVSLVRRTPGENGRPAAGDFEGLVADLQESQNAPCRIADAGDEILKLLPCMQCLFRLPSPAGFESLQVAPHALKHRQNPGGDGIAELRLDRDFP